MKDTIAVELKGDIVPHDPGLQVTCGRGPRREHRAPRP